MKNIAFALIFLLLIVYNLFSQNSQYKLPLKDSLLWDAVWIGPHEENIKEIEIYHFRKIFDLQNKPKEFEISISADNRYRIFVNGILLGYGPARCDINRWQYDTYNLSKYLKKGKNIIAIMVWDYGKDRAAAQMSIQPALIVQGRNDTSKIVNTGKDWEYIINTSIFPIKVRSGIDTRGGYLGPPCDSIVGEKYPWGWELSGSHFKWKDCKKIAKPQFSWGTQNQNDTQWKLYPRCIPFMESTNLSNPEIVSIHGAKANFEEGLPLSFSIDENTHAEIILDAEFIQIAYPKLIISGGQNAVVKLSYAESFYEPGQKSISGDWIDEGQHKGLRDKWQGKLFCGFHDAFVSNGKKFQLYRTLWFKTFRYIKLEITTTSDKLKINELSFASAHYPFMLQAEFNAQDKTLDKIYDASWKTLRACASEIYMDCPYYEQLQYTGDTRIQALASLYLSGDDRLMKNAIESFANSVTSEGLLPCRYPSDGSCIIPSFSLVFIGMVHDYWMNRNDPETVKAALPVIKSILDWYLKFYNSELKVLQNIKYWNFVDWPNEWKWDPEKNTGGVPLGLVQGLSCIDNLFFLYYNNLAIELLEAFEFSKDFSKYWDFSNEIGLGVNQLFYDQNKRLYADDVNKKEFSQHANALAVLAEIIQPEQEFSFDQVLNDSSLIQCSPYFRFYLHRAMKNMKQGNLYLQMLSPWKKMLAKNLNTFAERQDPTRSDCHGWSAHPAFDFLNIVAGIAPATPGFKSVTINPNPGDLKNIKVKFPHPNGMIEMALNYKSDRCKAEILLPHHLYGMFFYKGNATFLKPGFQKFQVLKQ